MGDRGMRVTAIAVRTKIPVHAGEPVVCSRCEASWVPDLAAMRRRYGMAVDPRLCEECVTRSRAEMVYKRRYDARRCICLGCEGHDGGCVERVFGKQGRCRACVQWTSVAGVFSDGEQGCARCGLGTSVPRLVCRLCEMEVEAWLARMLGAEGANRNIGYTSRVPTAEESGRP